MMSVAWITRTDVSASSNGTYQSGYAYDVERSTMIRDYIEAALERANYQLIDDAEPYYGEAPELQGVWATGETLEQCRQNLAEATEG